MTRYYGDGIITHSSGASTFGGFVVSERNGRRARGTAPGCERGAAIARRTEVPPGPGRCALSPLAAGRLA